MSEDRRTTWNQRHLDKSRGEPEPFVMETIGLARSHGMVLDVAAGRGRNAIPIARAGFRVVAADYSETGVHAIAEAARAERLAIYPVIADFDNFAFRAGAFDAIINVNFLDRALFAEFERALKPGGILIVDTFLIDQMDIGHPKEPHFLLQHHELRELTGRLELLRYREGLVVYPDGSRAWRGGAVARRRG